MSAPGLCIKFKLSFMVHGLIVVFPQYDIWNFKIMKEKDWDSFEIKWKKIGFSPIMNCVFSTSSSTNQHVII